MNATLHLRSMMLYFSVCGRGYCWPNTIALTNNLERVTCKECIATVGASG